MKLSEALMESMSQIDEKYLAQSETEIQKKHSFSLKPVLSFAAVFVLIIAVAVSPGFNTMKRFAGSTSDSMAAESAESSEFISDGIGADGLTGMSTVLYDQELLAYLDDLDNSEIVTVLIETDRVSDEEDSAKSAQTAEPVKADMTKEDILGFEGEERVTYIFHLYSADDME